MLGAEKRHSGAIKIIRNTPEHMNSSKSIDREMVEMLRRSSGVVLQLSVAISACTMGALLFGVEKRH